MARSVVAVTDSAANTSETGGASCWAHATRLDYRYRQLVAETSVAGNFLAQSLDGDGIRVQDFLGRKLLASKQLSGLHWSQFVGSSWWVSNHTHPFEIKDDKCQPLVASVMAAGVHLFFSRSTAGCPACKGTMGVRCWAAAIAQTWCPLFRAPPCEEGTSTFAVLTRQVLWLCTASLFLALQTSPAAAAAADRHANIGWPPDIPGGSNPSPDSACGIRSVPYFYTSEPHQKPNESSWQKHRMHVPGACATTFPMLHLQHELN